MKAVLHFLFCATGIILLVAAEPFKNSIPYSSDSSIALTHSSTGSELAKSVSEIDFTFRKQLQMAPLIEKTSKPDFVTSNREHIKRFFSILWHPTDLTSIWCGPNCSVVIRLVTENKKTAYFHVYLLNGKVPYITPWTGYDSASYLNASLLKFFQEIRFDIQEKTKTISGHSR